MSIEAKIVADSISARGRKRITTLQLRYPRFIHAEFMTHRLFSRNASSSRAIPIEKLIQEAETNPAMPIFWGKNQKGMQAAEELEGDALQAAKADWLMARDQAVGTVRRLAGYGLHKQTANRILEPFLHISVVVTATEWDNFFWQRNDPLAQPEMRVLAEVMLQAMNDSQPVERRSGDLHLPYVTDEERKELGLDICAKLSVARCARVSYNNHDGSAPDVKKDLELYGDRLKPSGHFSPFEHPAQPTGVGHRSGNLVGWIQFRKTIEGEHRLGYPKLKEKWIPCVPSAAR